MGIVKKMKLDWKMKTKREKAKTILRFVDGICNAALFGILGSHLTWDEDSYWKKKAINIGMFGLSMAATDLVGNSIDDFVDDICDRKEANVDGGV